MLEPEVVRGVLITLRSFSTWGSLAKWMPRGHLFPDFTYIGHCIDEASEGWQTSIRLIQVCRSQMDHSTISQQAQVDMEVEVWMLW
jgi:hypothetical protein